MGSQPSDVGALQMRAGHWRLGRQGFDPLEQFDADGVIEAAKFSLGVLDAAGQVGVLGEPAVAEPGVAFELGDTVSGSRDLVLHVLERWLSVRGPVLLGPGLGSRRGHSLAAPAVPLASYRTLGMPGDKQIAGDRPLREQSRTPLVEPAHRADGREGR